MEQRGTTDEAEMERRLRTAVWELSQIKLYDYQIVNDSVEHAARQLREIVIEEKSRRESNSTDNE